MRSELIALRHKLGLTQEEMAKLVNQKSRQQWCNIEAGKRNLTADEIVELGIKLNLSPEEQKKLLEVS